jgi:MerR family transcriptional regulator, light-induced transcriptional regulator
LGVFVMMTVSELFAESRKLAQIPLASTTAYKNHMPALIRFVDSRLNELPGIDALIGNNPRQVMYDNHKHHAAFMATVFSIGDYELLARTVLWVYRAYHSHGFSHDYFPVELKAWQEAVETHIGTDLAGPILAVYAWMIGNHELFIALSQSDVAEVMPVGPGLLSVEKDFLAALLEGDHRKCLAMALESVKEVPDIEQFYLQVIQTAMYEIGMLWEQGKVSVAQEHLASAIVGRVMATMSMAKTDRKRDRGKAVVTACPNEFHEIGAWMIADILELDGWNVQYLGANTPEQDLLEFLSLSRPDILAISVTMPFNIERAKDIIDSIRASSWLQDMKVMVGGRVFNDQPRLRRKIGADGAAPNLGEAKKLARSWRRDGD